MSIFKRISEYGISHAKTKSEERNIVLTNYISLTAAVVPIIVLISRLFFFDHDLPVLIILMVGCVVLLLPIMMNRVGFINSSGVVLCWIPYLFLFAGSITGVWTGVSGSSDFLVVRYFFLGFSCFPFLVFNLRSPLFIIGLLAPVLSILLFDPVMSFFGAGYWQQGFNESAYGFNTVRVFVSFLIIGVSSFSLKKNIEKSEAMNDQLLKELADKNRQIQLQADNEVRQLNQQLYANLQELSEREFLLNQSQRIAKIGSWEYRIEGGSLFWSDEMYNIFGLDKSYDLKAQNLSQLFLGEESTVLIDATLKLLRTGESYDLTLRTRTPLGYIKWLRSYAFPIHDRGNIIGVRGICHDITFFKEAQDRLRTSEEKFSKAFENYPDFIMIVREEDLLVVDVNQRIESVLGFEKRDVVGRSARYMDLFLEDNERQKFIQAYNEQGDIEYECPWRRKDGRIIQVNITATRIIIEGQYYRMSVVQDITERKAAEEKFLKAFNLSPDLMIIVRERDLVFVEANRKIKEISGFSREDVIGFNSQQKEFEIWAIPEEKKNYFETYYKEGFVFQEAQLRKKEGTTFFATVSAQRIELAGENHMIVVIRDITERKQEQEQLVLSQANLRATINNTEVLIWSVDRNFRLLMFNQTFAKHVKDQYGLDVQVGSRIFGSSQTPEGLEMTKKWTQHYLRALSGEVITLEETRFGIDFQYSLSPIIEGDQIIGVSVFADNVTERKAHDRELAEANKKVGELKLMALRSAMSPHFIFNVLNSIQFYITKNDRLNAINYLSTFSKLIRSILTHSVNNKIKLAEEIEMLKNYITLEMTRFENKFNFVLDVDPDVDVDAIEIPSLLIQPYVENAILHGLYKKHGPGTLHISIFEQDDTLVFEIEDDGIGRDAAMKLRKENFPSHKSMGIKLTEERLRLINEHHRAAFEIEDLVNENGACGTRVRIRVTF